MKRFCIFFLTTLCLAGFGCSKSGAPANPVVPQPFAVVSASINGKPVQAANSGVSRLPAIRLLFSNSLNRITVPSSVSFTSSGTSVPFDVGYENGDSAFVIRPVQSLAALSTFMVSVSASLSAKDEGKLVMPTTFTFSSSIDSSRKFPTISDSALLTRVQQQTFRYFWDLAHSVSGLARERNTSGDLVTSGGSGFGIMAIITGIHRNFITKAQGLERMQKMVGFLKNTAQTFQGAYPHWLNGATGSVIPFSDKDNGADLVETSFLVQGLLTARQYFDGAGADETTLRNDINTICNKVNWSFFQKNNEDVLYWHWSPDFGWAMNHQIKGWNECLVTYVLAASSTTHPITKAVYDAGWAGNGAIKNNNFYLGIHLPLGTALGGPLFFSHYSFLGINPNGLQDQYADYGTQTRNHSLINYNYCKANPNNFYGYSDSSWGLTASDIPGGYTASSPTNDVGVIAPTAALSSFPYTPAESLKALRFFYYTLGDKIFKEYGFVDAFSLQNFWFADSYLAIDQGPIIVMMENYRSGLLWDLFTSCPEVKSGMRKLGFSAPYL